MYYSSTTGQLPRNSVPKALRIFFIPGYFISNSHRCYPIKILGKNLGNGQNHAENLGSKINIFCFTFECVV